MTELVGDLVFQCTGGTPTPAGQTAPTTDITLTLNTNVTSRLLGNNFIDALLFIDEPWPASPNPSSEISPNNSPSQKACYSTGPPTTGSCNSLTGTYTGAAGANSGYGGTNSPYLAAGASTVYVAQTTATGMNGANLGNEVTWFGVPIDPPGGLWRGAVLQNHKPPR